MLAFWLRFPLRRQLLVELALDRLGGFDAPELLQAPGAHLHEIARLGGEGGAAVEPVQRLQIAVGVVGVPGAAGEQLRADFVALLLGERGGGGHATGFAGFARRHQRQRSAVGGVAALRAGGRRQRGFERLRGFARAALVQQFPAARDVAAYAGAGWRSGAKRSRAERGAQARRPRCLVLEGGAPLAWAPARAAEFGDLGVSVAVGLHGLPIIVALAKLAIGHRQPVGGVLARPEGERFFEPGDGGGILAHAIGIPAERLRAIGGLGGDDGGGVAAHAVLVWRGGRLAGQPV